MTVPLMSRHHLAKFVTNLPITTSFASGDINLINLSRDLTKPHDQRVMRILRLCKFSGRKFCENGDLMLLIYNMTSRDHNLKGLCAFMFASLSQ